MNLLIDDKKGYLLDGNGDEVILDIIARNYEAGAHILLYLWPDIDVLYLDFDLGTETEGFSGIDILKDLNIKHLPPKIQLVTMNPVGKKQMEDYLKDIGYEFKDGYWVR